jgi:hypothetical protein
MNYVKHQNKDISAKAEHCIHKNHNMDWANASVIKTISLKEK